MKSKQNLNKKNDKRSSYKEFDDKAGLKPIKSKSGKNSKRISIYDDLDDDFDESELENLKYNDLDMELENDFNEETGDDEH